MEEKTSILIVDDEAGLCKTLAKILDKKGYETATAESGFEALDMIKERAFDIALIDIKMPVMNGVETSKKIKEIRPGTITILITAFTVDDLIQEGIDEGAYAVLHKPLDIDVLVGSIENAKENEPLLTIVDDDPGICRIMKDILNRKGFNVTTCKTGAEAINATRERPGDILFIDMKMPALNGLETYMEIKRINPNAKAVLMTAYRQEMEDLVENALEEGVYTCLYKPFDMDEVIKLIGEVSKKVRNKPVENAK
ncbi:MAG: response regulator [Sedimentisphaerales bacterium]|nr:response regulator [Sedimentisphaerales bacterium]